MFYIPAPSCSLLTKLTSPRVSGRLAWQQRLNGFLAISQNFFDVKTQHTCWKYQARQTANRGNCLVLWSVLGPVGVSEECLSLVQCDVTHVCRLISREIRSNVPAAQPSPPLNQHMTSSPPPLSLSPHGIWTSKRLEKVILHFRSSSILTLNRK